jgi:hypothetical protein
MLLELPHEQSDLFLHGGRHLHNIARPLCLEDRQRVRKRMRAQ